jgi:hypothetical protein
MDKICLVEAGNYLLGIDAAAIIGKTDLESLVKGERMDDMVLLFLEPFFLQDKMNPSRLEFRVLELHDAAGSFFVALDTIRGEVPVGTHFETLPLLYPADARRCCPRIMMYGEEPVMLMDSGGLQEMVQQSHGECGVSSLGILRGARQARLLNQVSTDLAKGTDSPEKEQDPGLDDVQFKKIVAWAMGQYLDGCENDGGSWNNTELPPMFDDVLYMQGKGRELSQELARQVVQKCGSFQQSAVQHLKDRISGGAHAE